MNHKKLWAIAISMVWLLSACSTMSTNDGAVTVNENDIAVNDGSSTTGQVGDDVRVSGASQNYMMNSNAWRDPDSPLAQRKIYFSYDSSEINEEGKAMIALHAEYLVKYSKIQVSLLGHTDERGSREYNISLGERRAQAVRRLLEVHGVQAGQIELTSYGEEKPDLDGHDEEAWYFNRRVEIAYQE